MSRLYTILNNIANRILAINDYVMDEGFTGGWYYRKWNSGKYECWKKAWGTSSLAYTAWGNVYYADYNGPAFPITFTEAPIVITAPHGSQAYILGIYDTSVTGIGKIRFGHANGNNAASYAHIYVYGNWK